MWISKDIHDSRDRQLNVPSEARNKWQLLNWHITPKRARHGYLLIPSKY